MAKYGIIFLTIRYRSSSGQPTFSRGSIGISSRKAVIDMTEYIFGILYLIMLYKIVKNVK